MKIGFYSTMTGMPWGGSEVLWSRVAHQLIADGHAVTANCRWWEDESAHLQALRDAGASVWTRGNPTEVSPRKRFRLFPRLELEHEFIARWIASEQPDFVLITVDYHLREVLPAEELIRQGIPYAINLQCASAGYTPDWSLDDLRQAYGQAETVYFVSQENQDRVETNLAMKLARAKIIDNPFNVRYDAQPDWPSSEEGFRLACVGRIHFQSKGQDVLVNVLKQPKWRERELQISIVGEDQSNERQLIDLITLHRLQDQIQLAGFSHDIESVWANHHGLVLPSRYEGAALAVVEALLCNRICVTTDLGRNSELIDDGETGFIASAATVTEFDRTLESAWQARSQWQAMGRQAGKRIRDRYGSDPVAEFSKELDRLFRTAIRESRQESA